MLAFSVKKNTTDPVWIYMYNDHVFRAIDFNIFKSCILWGASLHSKIANISENNANY